MAGTQGAPAAQFPRVSGPHLRVSLLLKRGPFPKQLTPRGKRGGGGTKLLAGQAVLGGAVAFRPSRVQAGGDRTQPGFKFFFSFFLSSSAYPGGGQILSCCHGSGASRRLHLQWDGGLWADPPTQAEAPVRPQGRLRGLNDSSSFLLLSGNWSFPGVRQSQVAAL